MCASDFPFYEESLIGERKDFKVHERAVEQAGFQL